MSIQIVRIAAAAAILGALILFGGTLLHPAGADPNDAQAAFAEYAADQTWVASHLMQLLGVILMVLGLVLVSKRLAQGNASGWAWMAGACAVASLAVGGALQAVDGVALKAMVDRWAAASGTDKTILFQATFAVRQVEVGIATIFSLLIGVAAILYGAALVSDHHAPNWLGGLAFVGGISLCAAGVLYAYSGFSELGMLVSMVASLLLLIWVVALGVWMWRSNPVPA